MATSALKATTARPPAARRVTRPVTAQPAAQDAVPGTPQRPSAMRRPAAPAPAQDEYLEGISARTTAARPSPKPREKAAPVHTPAPALAVPSDLDIPEPTGIATPAELAALFQRFGPIKYFQGQQQTGYTLGYHLQLVLDQVLRDKGLV